MICCGIYLIHFFDDSICLVSVINPRSHRKQCLMLLKSLIEGLKQRFPTDLEDLCSYHGKTVFLHTLSTRYHQLL